MESIENRLGLVSFTVDSESHIKPKEEKCDNCRLRVCLYVCPAKLYRLEEGKIYFNHEGCLECGTCRVACPEELEWEYPRGGFGVHYQFG